MSGNKLAKDIFIVAAKRTPFGAFGGSLKDMSAVTIGTAAATAAVEQMGKPDIIDSVVMGNVSATTTDCSFMARHIGLKAGVKEEKPMLTINRLCGSGFQSIITGAQEISMGDAEVVLTGGAECMSMAPYTLHGTRWGSPLSQNNTLVDSLWDGLTDAHIKMPMAVTAENLADKCGVNRAESDEIALESQKRWAAANEAGRFKNEIAPMTLKGKRGKEVVFDTDEHPRPKTEMANLTKLAAVFKKGGDGTVTAGNASGISDGASAIIIASGEAVKEHGLKPIARVVSYGIAGVPPEIMGYGPVPAFKIALEKAGLTVDDMDICEINEAFASQFLSCAKELNLDLSKTNVNGGAIALGHPTGASGSRIMGHLAYELQRTGSKYAIGGACIGGGQGIAIVLEGVN